jgi:hypothetical protein
MDCGFNRKQTMRDKQELIDEILDCFKFERVHKAMVALEWSWSSTGGVPEPWDIRASARRHMKSAYDGAMHNKIDYISSSGGLWAKAHYCTEHKCVDLLELHFCIDEWQADATIKCES